MHFTWNRRTPLIGFAAALVGIGVLAAPFRIAGTTQSSQEAAVGVALSADPAQRFVYVADGSNERIAIQDRTSLEEIGHIGGPGRKAGEFFHLHSLDVDPQGNIVTGESQGYRVQKFIYKGLSTTVR